ncbi:uncharacterized protein LOC142173482 [Nicotiana tabacum]|uniref:Uncharacterized protein LOC142173482 n=1 Tax=Nicotiana tabacum TaxID=4097 RepID=A0AC58TD95_TOBAC
MDIASYFNKLKILWDELRFMRASRGSSCTCSAKSELQREDEENELHQFLMELNKTYVGVRRNLLMMQPPPSLGTAYSILLQDERQRQVSSPSQFSVDSSSLNVHLTKNVSTSSSPILQSSPTLIDPSYPLYVHPSDNPSILLVSVPFLGTGYTSWRKNILIALSAKNKSGLINSRIPQPPPSSPLYDYWVRCNDMVFDWLSNSLSKDIVDSVNLHYDTVRDLWRDIKEMYGQSSASRYYQIQRKITGFTNGPKSFSQKVNFDIKRTGLVCKYCKSPGHSIDKCYKFHGFPSDFKFTKGRNKEQYQHLMILFQQSHISPSQDSTDNTTAMATCAVDQLSCTAFFTKIFCHLQGPSLRRPLEIGRASNGLYVIDSVVTLPTPTSSVHNTTNKRSVSLPQSTPLVNNISNKASVSLCDYNACISTCNLDFSINKTDLFWHQRLGHMPFHRMQSIEFLSDKLSSKQSFICPVCPLARQQRLPFLDSSIKFTKPFQLVHTDLWGPYHTRTYNDFRYFLTIVDDFSRVTWTHLFSCKSNAFDIIKAFVLMVKIHVNLHVQTIRSDNTFELGSNTKASSFFAEYGILHQTTIPHTPQQISVVDKKNKHLLETSRALLFQSKLPIKYWGDCVLTTTYLINRFPSTVLQHLSPYQKLHGHPPTYAHLRTFGCLCFATIP